jgi:hypothetical protein
MSDHHEFDSPVDLPKDGAPKRALGWMTVTIFVASLFLLVTNAFALKGWIDEQPAGPLQARLASWAGDWEVATDALGLGVPRAQVHRLWKESEAARFTREPPADQR